MEVLGGMMRSSENSLSEGMERKLACVLSRENEGWRSENSEKIQLLGKVFLDSGAEK